MRRYFEGASSCVVVLHGDSGDASARIVAYYEDDTGGGGAAGAGGIARHAELTLAPYMLPAALIGLPSLPRLANDKVGRRRLHPR